MQVYALNYNNNSFCSMNRLLFGIAQKMAFSTTTKTQLPNYYQLFNLSFNFTEQQLKTSYLELVKKYHPDLSSQPNAAEVFRQIQEGYDLLSDQAKRFQYQSKQKDSTPSEEDSCVIDEMKDKYLKNFMRNDPINDEYNFSYKLFKEHYEKVQDPKKDYLKYEGQGESYFARKGEQGQKTWVQVGGAAIAIGAIAAAYYYTNS